MSRPGSLSTAIIGGLVGVAVHVMVVGLSRICIRHWRLVLLALATAWVADRCSGPSARAEIMASFRGDKIILADLITGPAFLGGRGIGLVEATVTNDASATIYDLRLICEYRTASSDRWEWTPTETHVGEIPPGSAERVRLYFETDGALLDADRATISCEPDYEIDEPMLLRARGRADLDPLAQISAEMTSSAVPHPDMADRHVVKVTGRLRSTSDASITRLSIRCRVGVGRYGQTQMIHRDLGAVLAPGGTTVISEVVGTVHVRDPRVRVEEHYCHINGVETRG